MIMISMAKRFSVLIVLLCVFVLNVQNLQAYEAPDFEIESEAILIYNQTLDQVIYSINADEVMVPASLTKIVTALVILETQTDLTKEVKVTDEMLTGLSGASIMKAWSGEIFTIEELLYGLMLPSGCDASQILAIADAGSEAKFVEKMNEYVDKMGLSVTHFRDSSGLSETGQVTTANEMLEILKVAKAHPILSEIMSTSKYTIEETNLRSEPLVLNNSISSLKNSSNSLYTSQIIGGKTGYNINAGTCLASFGLVDDHEYLIVTLNAGRSWDYPYSFLDANHLYQWLDDSFVYTSLIVKDQVIKNIEIIDSDIKTFDLVSSEDRMILLQGDDKISDVTINVEVLKNIAPILKGESIAEVTVYYQDQLYEKFDVVLEEDIEKGLIYIIRDFVIEYAVFIVVGMFLLLVGLCLLLRRRIKRPKRYVTN